MNLRQLVRAGPGLVSVHQVLNLLGTQSTQPSLRSRRRARFRLRLDRGQPPQTFLQVREVRIPSQQLHSGNWLVRGVGVPGSRSPLPQPAPHPHHERSRTGPSNRPSPSARPGAEPVHVEGDPTPSTLGTFLRSFTFGSGCTSAWEISRRSSLTSARRSGRWGARGQRGHECLPPGQLTATPILIPHPWSSAFRKSVNGGARTGQPPAGCVIGSVFCRGGAAPNQIRSLILSERDEAFQGITCGLRRASVDRDQSGLHVHGNCGSQ
jgi:hypothetical protein